jgi:Alginate export
MWCWIAGTSLSLAAMGPAQPAEETAPPPFLQLRYDEDYSYLQDPEKRRTFVDRIKYVPLGDVPGRYLSLGGEARPFLEWFRNEEWGTYPGDDGYLLQRYMAHVDLHWNRRLRLFAQLKSGIETSRSSGPRTVDEDLLDLHQAFLDVKLTGSGERSLMLRAGRQEMSYGHQRLVDFREGPNVRRSFDGVKAILQTKGWRADVFVTRPVRTKRGVFDDSPDPEKAFWGIYATRRLTTTLGLDVYYLGLSDDAASYDQGTAKETRHTNGARLFGKSGGFDYDVELIYQWGSFGGGDIDSWAVAPVFGYTLRGLAWVPRLALSLDVHSGDRDPLAASLETYHPLFPKGAYYGLIVPFGPSNHREIHPVLELRPARGLEVKADWMFFWRQSRRDGIYDLTGSLLRTGQQSDAGFVGHSPGIEIGYSFDRYWAITGNLSRFFAGRFLQETPPGKDIVYGALWLTLKF